MAARRDAARARKWRQDQRAAFEARPRAKVRIINGTLVLDGEGRVPQTCVMHDGSTHRFLVCGYTHEEIEDMKRQPTEWVVD